MRVLLTAIILSTGLAAAASAEADDDQKYDKNGVTFTYPNGWKEKTTAVRDVTTVAVGNDQGAQLVVQLYPAEAKPKSILEELERTYKEVVGRSAKAADVKHKLFGAEREGRKLATEKGPTALEFYAFELPSKRPVAVTLQYPVGDEKESKKQAEMKEQLFKIADSLEEKQ